MRPAKSLLHVKHFTQVFDCAHCYLTLLTGILKKQLSLRHFESIPSDEFIIDVSVAGVI